MDKINDTNIRAYHSETNTSCYYNPLQINSTDFVFSEIDSNLAGSVSSVGYLFIFGLMSTLKSLWYVFLKLCF